MLLSGPSQVSLASDFMWNLNSREANASFGYDYVLRQCRLRGRIDTGGEMRGGTASRRACVRVCVSVQTVYSQNTLQNTGCRQC